MTDLYLYEDTDVLRNKADIRHRWLLEKFERLHTGDRILTLPADIPVSADGYRQIHQHIFQDVYEWAGQDRAVDIAKNNELFCLAPYVKEQLEDRFNAIQQENNLRGLNPEQFADRAAEHICELNAIHPFREGNGRTQRAFLEVLGRHAGHEIDLARIEPGPWNEASIESFRSGDYSRMRDVIAIALVRDREREQEGGREGDQRRDGEARRDDHPEPEAPRTSPERERTERAVESDDKRKRLEQHAERLEGVSYYLAKRAADRERGGGGRER